jgi:hypothetical protein
MALRISSLNDVKIKFSMHYELFDWYGVRSEVMQVLKDMSVSDVGSSTSSIYTLRIDFIVI